MPDLTRRDFVAASGLATGALLTPVHALANSVKPIRIREVDLFRIVIPVSKAEEEAGVYNRYTVVKIATDAGVNGYSFDGPALDALPAIRQLLVGQDLFAVEQHLAKGLGRWGSVEHAIWDAIGKIGNQPVYRLLGGWSTSVTAYLTCVWKDYLKPTRITYQQQAEMALKIRKAGFKAMKIQAWRPNPMDNVEACAQIRSAVGRDFAIMVDRTAHAPEQVGQEVWDYETGLQVARGLEKCEVTWLEEPFARNDYESSARLAAAVDISIAGGEGYSGLEPFRQSLVNRSYDIVQPDARNAGGILMTRKVAMLAEAFHVPCVLHGLISLMAAGWLQASLAIGSEWQELVYVRPPLMPEELWAPGLKVLKSSEMYTIRDGELLAPEHPGLGLDVDEEALGRFRQA